MAVKKKSAGNGFDHLFMTKVVEKLVGFLRKVLSQKLLDFCIKWLFILGNWAIYLVAVLAILFGLIGAIRLGSDSFGFFLYALIFVIAILVAQYVAKRFAHAGETLIENNPSKLSSSAFLDSVGLLAILLGAGGFLYGVYMAIRQPAFIPLLWGVGAFISLGLVALIALNPRTITVDVVEETSAGQEAIGIITFFIKKFMRLVPIIFGIALIYLTVMFFIDALGLFSDAKMGIAGKNMTKGYVNLVAAGLIPFFGYLIFVFAYLMIDIIRAILSIPGKLDKLGK